MQLKYESYENGIYKCGIKEFSQEEFEKIIKEEEQNMSVPSYLRKISSVDYLARALDLVRYTTSMCQKISKKYTFYGGKKLFETVYKLMDNLLHANRLDVVRFNHERRLLLYAALGDLDSIQVLLEIVVPYIKFKKKSASNQNKEVETDDTKAKEKAFIKWTTLIQACESLIKGVIKSDKLKEEKENTGAQL